MKSLLLLTIPICIISCNFLNAQKSNSNAMNNGIQIQRLRLKNLAFCQCQSRVDSNTLSLDDASAAGFVAYLAYKEGIIEDLQFYTKKWINDNEKKYKSYSNSPLTNMKCLDYYNSKELKDFILKQREFGDSLKLKFH